MSATPLDLRLFGFDLRTIGREVKNAVLDLPNHPLFAWLSPSAPLCLCQVDGQTSFWQGGKLWLAPANTAAPSLLALEYPEDGILRRNLRLPVMSATAVASAVALEAYSSSPFAQSDLVWGYCSQKNKMHPHTLQIELVLASRKQVEIYMQQKGQSGFSSEKIKNSANLAPTPTLEGVAAEMQNTAYTLPPEIWALSTLTDTSGAKTPIVIQGFGEAQRANVEAKGRRKGWMLLSIIALLLIAVVATPTLQLRQRALAAQTAFSVLQKRTASLSEQREALVKMADRIQHLNTITADQLDALGVINAITHALPDDTALLSLRASGQTINMYGQTENAAVLMTHLSTQPGLHNVKAPSPASRPPGAAKESFNIELTLNLQEEAAGTAVPSTKPQLVLPDVMGPNLNQDATQATPTNQAPKVGP